VYHYSNSHKRIIQSYAGVIHLVDGFCKAGYMQIPKQDRHLKPMILKPDWVSDAIGYANLHLKAMLIEKYLKETGNLNSNRKSRLDITKIIDVKILYRL
jgi:hypothetical protein